MGFFTATSSNLINHPAEKIYDFVSNPHNWKRTFKGSEGPDAKLTLPLKVGDTWTELIKRSETFSCQSTWTLITAERPRKWVFQQINGIGEQFDGTGGVDGITTISYTFEPMGDGQTLFTRTLHCELPHGVRIHDELLVARTQPANIDDYHTAIAAELDALND